MDAATDMRASAAEEMRASGPDLATAIRVHAECDAIDAAIVEADEALAAAVRPLTDAAQRIAHVAASLSSGSRCDLVADDLRAAARQLTGHLDDLPAAIERVAERLTAGVEADVARRLAAAERALSGPSLGAVARGREVAA